MSRSPKRYEVVVVGGGPVGSALALSLHRLGKSVLLVDQGKARDKVCGEGLLPSGWSVLSRLGVVDEIQHRSPIRGLRYFMADSCGSEQPLQMTADLSLPAFGVSRRSLMDAFSAVLAREQVPVQVSTTVRDFRVQSGLVQMVMDSGQTKQRIQTELLIGADGLHSQVRRIAKLDRPAKRRHSRWGCRVHFRANRDITQRVWVTLGRGIESYLTPLGDRNYGLAFLWSPTTLGQRLPGQGPLWSRLMSRMPPFPFQLEEVAQEFLDGEKAIGPLHQPVVSPLHPNCKIALIGDASGYLDALTGEGLCLGLRQVELLSSLIAKGRLRDYPRAHRDLKKRHVFVVNGLLWLLSQPELRHRVFRALAECPSVFQSVISFAVEEAPPSVFLDRELPHFLLRLLKCP